jgi:hypothetical protein
MSVASTTKGRHFRFQKPIFGVYVEAAHSAQKAFHVQGYKTGTGNPFAFINDPTRSLAGGGRSLYVFQKQTTNVLTGTNEAIRGRAENGVASMTGTIHGGIFVAANREDSSGGTMMALSAECMAKGKTIGTIRGAEIVVDNAAGTGTLTRMIGLRVRVIGAAATMTNGPWGVQIVNDSETALANAKPLKAFIRMETTAGAVQNCAIDATEADLRGAALFSVSLTAKDNVLFYYKDFDDTAHAVVATDGDALALRT